LRRFAIKEFIVWHTERTKKKRNYWWNSSCTAKQQKKEKKKEANPSRANEAQRRNLAENSNTVKVRTNSTISLFFFCSYVFWGAKGDKGKGRERGNEAQLTLPCFEHLEKSSFNGATTIPGLLFHRILPSPNTSNIAKLIAFKAKPKIPQKNFPD
jgi:hypothetical protein